MIQSCQPHVLFELLGEYCPVLVICYCWFCRVVHSTFKQYFCLTPHKGVQYESLSGDLLVVVFYRFVISKCSLYTSLVFWPYNCSSRFLIFIFWGGLIINFNVFFKYFFRFFGLSHCGFFCLNNLSLNLSIFLSFVEPNLVQENHLNSSVDSSTSVLSLLGVFLWFFRSFDK